MLPHRTVAKLALRLVPGMIYHVAVTTLGAVRSFVDYLHELAVVA